MTTRHLPLLLLLVFFSSAPRAFASPPSAAAAGRVNVVWITAEDLSPRLGSYGDRTVPTPNLDRLAAEGVRYTRAFANTAVCGPARHALITGMYATSTYAMHMRNGARTSALGQIKDPEMLAYAKNRPLYEAVPPPHVRCFTEHLRAAGYYATNNRKEDYQFRAPPTAWDDSSDKAHWRHRQPGQPFFAVFNFTDTHESGVHDKRRSPPVVDPANVSVPPYYPDTPTVRADLAKHYNNIAALDKKVGGIIRQLEEDGLLESTVVFFFGDHGDGLPRSKRWVYDSGTRVPLLIRHPGARNAGTTEGRLVSFVDFAPTVLSLVGLPVPDGLHGEPFLGERRAPPGKYVFLNRDRNGENVETIRAVRGERFRYVRNYRPDEPYIKPLAYRDRAPLMQEIHRSIAAGTLGPDQWQFTSRSKPGEELYDTDADPHEIRNLAGDPQHAAVLKEMRAALEGWLELTGDPLTMSEFDLVKKRVWPPDGEQPRTATPTYAVAATGDGRRTVEVSCATPGASIGYRHGGKGPWMVYRGPVSLDGDGKLEIVAQRIGYRRSETVVVPSS